MAILSILPKISVTVHNAQGQLPEYADDEPDAVKKQNSPFSVVVSNYVEVPSDGGPFWLKFRVEAPYTHRPNRIIFAFEDPAGYLVQMSCGPHDLVNAEPWERLMDGYYDYADEEALFRSFQFTKLNILPGDGESDDISEMDRKRMAKLGMLEVRVLLGTWQHSEGSEMGTADISESIDHAAFTANIATEKVSERKSLSLGMTYNNEVVDANEIPEPADFIYLNGWWDPVAIFRFKYRSRADLQKLLLVEKSPELEELPREKLLPTLPTTPLPSCAPSLTPASKAFEDLTFSEVRDLARKQYMGFDKVGGDEMETLAKQKHAEQMEYANDEVTRLFFDELTFAQVRNLAKKQHKSFEELNTDEIEKLARQKHSESIVSPQALISGAADERNGQGKRKAPIKAEDADGAAISVLAKKRK
ncbi:hypothetical protein VE01_00136 [Pseudogymnoascus verrucosus]|uniref:DUF7918 domain-containing protein n=1 Tax=Pseudogymnoascus verrucosus TaxID=342668 RepID=A0A2P2SWW7_9PEZI|nr:uncharacterized protein VE01_00136 [Pseudogymnoascus verrucosus]OBU01348.1 hypothetical protein VE01_00136 [Pseudogymnoascus verrucosus]